MAVTTDLAGHLIHTRENGTLADMTVAEVADVVAAAAAKRRVVLHFHGGLNPREVGEANAARWLPVYEGAGAHPVFFIWQSGFLDTIKGNVAEIAREEIFERTLRWVVRYTVGILRGGGGRGEAVELPTDQDVRQQFERRERGQEPYRAEPVPDDIAPIDDELQHRLEASLSGDAALMTALAGAVAARQADTGTGIGTAQRMPASRAANLVAAPSSSLIDADVLDELAADADEQGRGIFTSIAFARLVGRILVRIGERFRAGTDSGVYPTTVEEVLRGLYLANVGGTVWKAMKQETADTFDPADQPRGGRSVMDALVRQLATGPATEITLVGHSTGAVFIDNLLADLVRAKAAGEPAWSDEVTLRVVLLAPASTFTHMTAVLDSYRTVVAGVRVFMMSDSAERADHVGGAVYPRSLLYLVSGVLEQDVAGTSAVTPLVGLQRYVHTGPADPLRTFLGATGRVVYSPTAADAPIGQRSQARGHTQFNSDAETMASVAALIDGSARWD